MRAAISDLEFNANFDSDSLFPLIAEQLKAERTARGLEVKAAE